MPETQKVLLVDDDPNVLQAYQRRLRRRFDIETALCSEEGVTAVDILGPFAVVVSDMQMPRENGASFLRRILQRAPESVRIMLTGNADQQTAADAVNVGRVFRFLNKPCPAEDLEAAIEAGIVEHQRLKAEREAIAGALVGAVNVLTKVLAATAPAAFGRGERLKQLAADLALAAELSDTWELEMTASLCPLGAITFSDALADRLAAGEPLDADESALVANQYRVAAEMIGEAPSLAGVAELVRLIDEPEAFEQPTPRQKRFAGLMRLAIDFDNATAIDDRSAAEAVLLIEKARPRPATDDLAALRKVVAKRDYRRLVEVGLEQLAEGMRLAADVTTPDGRMLVAKGQDVTPALKLRLQSHADAVGVAEPLSVLVRTEVAERLEVELAAVS